MVKIRLSRRGAKKRPFYPIVVTDSRTQRDGKSIERLGFFNPFAEVKEERLRLDLARLELWIKRGAQASTRVAFLIKEAKAPELAQAKRAQKQARLKATKKKATADLSSEANSTDSG